MRRDPSTPIVQDVVLVGGGHAHALVLARWAMRPTPGVRLTLVSPEPMTPYTGMLPGFVAGHYALDEVEIDLDRLARRAGADLILDRAVGLDRDARRLKLADPTRLDLPYDVVSFDVGSHTDPPDAGLSVAPTRPLTWFRSAFEPFLDRVRAGDGPLAIAVVGAGVGGAELAMALAHRLRAEAPGDAAPSQTILLDRSDGLSAVPAALRRRLLAGLRAYGVRHETRFDAAPPRDGVVRAVDGRDVAADLFILATGSRAAPWLAATGLALDEGGYIRVRSDLRAVGDDRVFATGDVAAFEADPRPKAGVFAVRQAPTLFHNLRAVVCGGALRAYKPQRDYLKLVSLGGKAAAAEKWGRTVAGPGLWRWKDRIDRAFMARVSQPPEPPQPVAPAGGALGLAEALRRPPLCVGCGGKIGAPALTTALASSGSGARRADVQFEPGDDAAILSFGGDGGGEAGLLVSVDDISPVVGDLERAAEIAVIHAFGDVWARGGEPMAALLSLTVAPMTAEKQAQTLARLVAGADAALSRIGAARAGGHSAEAAETRIGVTAIGRAAHGPESELGQGGARPGDALVLTKPLGTGLLLVGAMRGLVSGRDMAAAIESMRAPSGPAADALKAVDARAATDVTGFGLLGHLWRILERSSASAELDLGAIPLLSGASSAVRDGVRSSLRDANSDVLAHVDLDGASWAAVEALIDPQTAGGLLAAVPTERVGDLDATQIGRIVAAGETGPRIRVRAG